MNSASHKNLWREVHSTTGYLSGHPKAQYFGLGRDSIADVRIIWPSGQVQEISRLAANRSHIVVQQKDGLPEDDPELNQSESLAFATPLRRNGLGIDNEGR